MNRWYFWVLAPIMLVTAIGMPFITAPPTWQGTVILYLFCGTLVSATIGLAKPRRFRWALKIAAGAILLAYVAYVLYELVAWWHGKPFGTSRESQSNLRNALLGLATFGMPSLYFILKGRSGGVVDVILETDQHAPVLQAFAFNSTLEAAAFVAAVSRQLDAPAGRSAARDALVEIWAHCAPDDRATVYLSEAAVAVANRSFRTLPAGTPCQLYAWPEDTALIMDSGSIRPMGIDESAKLLGDLFLAARRRQVR